MITPPLPQRPIQYAELDGLGIGPAELRRLLDEGSLRRVLRGVYVPGDFDDSTATRAACARLVLPPRHVVCDVAAAWLHGVDCHEPAALDVTPRLEVVATGGGDRTRRPQLLGGKRDLQRGEIVTVHGILVTSPLRTAADIACLRGRSRALASLDAISREFGLTREDFATILPRYKGRRGCRQLRELVALMDPGSESPGESWTRLAILDAGLPCPKLQVSVWVEGWGWVRLDHAYEHLKIAVEYDGKQFHGPEQRQHDVRRGRPWSDKAGSSSSSRVRT